MAYGYRSFKRSWYKKSGVQRAQQSGRRYFKIAFPVEELAVLTIAAGTEQTPNYSSDLIRTSPLAMVTTETADLKKGHYAASLLNSTAFRVYTTLYDSMKITGVRYNISIAKAIGGSSDVPACRIYTSWDRMFNAEDGMPTVNQLLNGPESQCVTFINNSKCRFSRSNYAADMQEKIMYIDSTVAIGGNVTSVDMWWNRRAPCYCPSLCIVAQTADSVMSPRVIPIQIQATYYITFRNPKYGLSAGASRGFEGMKLGVIEDIKKDAEEKEEEEAPVLKKKKVVPWTWSYGKKIDKVKVM